MEIDIIVGLMNFVSLYGTIRIHTYCSLYGTILIHTYCSLFLHPWLSKQAVYFRKLNGSGGPVNKRPSSASSQPASKKRRSRSKSPPKSARNRHSHRASKAHSDDKDKFPPSASVFTTASGTPQQVYGNAYYSNLLNSDNKPLPTNGFTASAADMWNYHRETLLSQMNPALDRPAQLHLLSYDRTKVPNLASLNGFHNASNLSNPGALPTLGGPPPLIPTSQAMVSTHLSSLTQQNNASNDGFRR